MSYEIAFNQTFKDGLLRLPRSTYPAIDRQIAWLATDPYAHNPNAKCLKNVRQTFRMRIGKDVRMLYRVHGQRRRVDIFNIGGRGSIYSDLQSRGRELTAAEAAALRAMLSGHDSDGTLLQEAQFTEETLPMDVRVEVEHLPWISDDELFILGVPANLWPGILAAGSLEHLQSSNLPIGIKLLIEDYWTNPNGSQVEKLYTLAPEQDVAAIAQQPLGHFLLALDPEQKEALKRLKTDGPYLVKGSAGTGKSLVGLYHMRDLITSHAASSLFDGGSEKFCVITYTNTLVDANLALLHGISPASEHGVIECTTLDRLAYQLAELQLGFKPTPLNTEGLSKWLEEQILPTLPAESANLVQRLGTDYVADEIEQSIIGNGLSSVDDYVKHNRSGRKRPLRETERAVLWGVFEALNALLQRKRVQTFEQWRSLALQYLRAHPEYPRYAAMFVDEAQDFSKVARQLCLELVRNPRHLVLAADTGQSIYTVPQSWLQSDARFDFNRRKPIQLSRSYRATREIGLAIGPLRADPGDENDQSPNASPVFSGPKPRWIDAKLADQIALVSAEIARLLNTSSPKINAGQVAVIVRDTQRGAWYAAELLRRGVRATQVMKGMPLQLAGDSVHIVTAHSCKGLGFPIVFVVDVHAGSYPASFEIAKAKDDQQREQIVEKEQRLLYVALSRASHQLIMAADPQNPSPFLKKLDRAVLWS